MGSKQIRIGQLISPFGPGSLYTDRRGTPHVVAGLDFWFMTFNAASGTMEPCADRTEFELTEPRLSGLLGVDRFCLPPDYRQPRQGQTPPPNAGLYVPALRFPRWYRHTRTGQLHRFNLHTADARVPGTPGRWQPVRFIAVCGAGHLCEFPWKAWIGCQCEESELYLIDRGGSELSSIRVECHTCPEGSAGRRGRHLAGTTVPPDGDGPSAFQSAGISCPGEKPWLGEGAHDERCESALVGALINQSNIYFPRIFSAISLPSVLPADEQLLSLRSEVAKEEGLLGPARTLWRMGLHREAAAMLQPALADRGVKAQPDALVTVLKDLIDAKVAAPVDVRIARDPELPLLTLRREEFGILRGEVNDAKNVPDLRVIPAAVSDVLSPWVARVGLVERLRETRVFCGFDRLRPGTDTLSDMPDFAMKQLFRRIPAAPQERWLPAAEVFGEGIYLELQEERLTQWLQQCAPALASRLDADFLSRLASVPQCLPPLSTPDVNWAARFLLVHSLAHILISQLVFECGYSTASLRERLYISADPDAPMAGLMIYTAAGDADGTLGGLVQLGRAERLTLVFQRALSRATWCSSDPVCSEQLGGRGSQRANLAACHACALLPETSCETINQGLDRAMVAGTPENRALGFFRDFDAGTES